MPTVTIDLGSEISNISTYDVYISECDPISWQLIADDITFSDFPIYVDPLGYGINGPCVEYYISGDTGCECNGNLNIVTPTPTPTVTPSITPSITNTPTVTPSITNTPTITPSITNTPTITPTISITPTNTPTVSITPTQTPPPCEVLNIETIVEGSPPQNVNVFLGYMPTNGSGAYQSICDLLLCDSIESIGIGSALIECQISIPITSGLPTVVGECVEIQYPSGIECITYSQTQFNEDCVPVSFASQELYIIVPSELGNTVYTLSECAGGMSIQLYGTCDHDPQLPDPTGLIVGVNVQLNENGQWTFNGEVEPTLELSCGIEYHFHVCSSGSTTQLWFADNYSVSSETPPDGIDALNSSNGVDNNGAWNSTIVVATVGSGFPANITGGLWYGTNGIEGAAGQISIVGGC